MTAASSHVHWTGMHIDSIIAYVSPSINLNDSFHEKKRFFQDKIFLSEGEGKSTLFGERAGRPR